MSGIKASKEGQVYSPECMNPKNAKKKAAKSISLSLVTGDFPGQEMLPA